MSSGGKGSKPRPFSVDKKTFDKNWDKIFKHENELEQYNADVRVHQYKDGREISKSDENC